MAARMNMTDFWDIEPCTLIERVKTFQRCALPPHQGDAAAAISRKAVIFNIAWSFTSASPTAFIDVVLRHRSKFYILPFASTSYSSCIHMQYCRQKKWLNFTITRETRLKHYVTSHRDASEKLSHEHGEQRPFRETLSQYLRRNNSVAPEPEGSSPYSQEPETGPYPEPIESLHTANHPMSLDPFRAHTTIYASVYRMVSFLRTFAPKSCTFSVLSHACHIPRPPQSPWLDLPNDIWGCVQTMKLKEQ
jgi:hypothetical protein